MSEFFQSLPFVAAIAFLIIGVIKLRKFLFIASFLILVAACIFALATDGSSGAFSFMGCFVLIFGLVCVVLSRFLRPGSFISRDGLRGIGALLLVLGFAGIMIV